ncbi:MAG: hypothetical protein WD227_06825, partial [Vicinamibacterales bacterium]
VFTTIDATTLFLHEHPELSHRFHRGILPVSGGNFGLEQAVDHVSETAEIAAIVQRSNTGLSHLRAVETDPFVLFT